MVAAFIQIDSSVLVESQTRAFTGDKFLCSVDDDVIVDFDEISVGFILSFNGVGKHVLATLLLKAA